MLSHNWMIPVKITFVIQDMFAQGAQRATALMAHGFAAKGYDVDLIVSQYHSYIAASNKTLRPFDVPDSVNWIFLDHVKARRNVLQLRKYLIKADSYAVICMSPNYSAAVRLAAVGLRKRPLIVHVEHGLAGMLDDYTILQPPRKFTMRRLRDIIYWRKFDRVFTVSKHGEDDFARMHPDFPRSRIATVYNPVVDENFWRKMKSAPSHSWLSAKDRSWFTFVTAAAHEEYKGHFNLLRAMEIIRDFGERIRVVIFGKGSLTESYEKYINNHSLSDYVSIGGFTNNFPAEASGADAFVLPSNLESFGIVLVEALACGLPVVSTDAPFGPREILEDGKYGVLVPVKDPTALARAMCYAAHKTPQPISDDCWKRFTVEAAVERYEKALGI